MTNEYQYTYYTVTAFHIRVPVFIKRTLTSMQITQFLIGASIAMLHSFVSYTIPVIASSQTGAAASSASAAANRSGVVRVAADVLHSIKGTYSYQEMPCVTGNGATWAVWLNVVYLAPLTYLFISFFIESYTRRTNAQQTRKAAARRMSNVELAEKAGWDAAKSMEREVYGESNEEAIATETKKANGRTSANGRVLRSRQ